MIGIVASLGTPRSPWHELQTSSSALNMASAAVAGAPSAARTTSTPATVEKQLAIMPALQLLRCRRPAAFAAPTGNQAAARRQRNLGGRDTRGRSHLIPAGLLFRRVHRHCRNEAIPVRHLDLRQSLLVEDVILP